MAKALTRRQREVLDFIVESIRDEGYPPTIAEIGARFSISSTNGVNDHLLALERKGYIERSSKARGIRITDKAAVGLYQTDVAFAPLVGSIAAGQPLLAEENIESFIPVQSGMVHDGAFCLRVTGDSMIEAGILDGDTLIVDPSRKPRTGDVVVALVDDEATVKHYHPRNNIIELRPANAAMAPMHFPARDVRIQGVAVGLQRSFSPLRPVS